MEGSSKKTITSKDILRSLSESRDDHLRQQNDPLTINNSGTCTDIESTRNDPWSVAVAINSNSANNQRQETEYHLDFVDSELEGEDEEKNCLSSLARVCICCDCGRTRDRHRRGRLQSVGSNLTAEEEGEYLMDCDELGLTWEKNS